MSDVSGGGGGVEVVELEAVFSADTSVAQQAAMALASKITQVGQVATGQTTSGFRLFGSAAVQSIDGIVSSAQRMNTEFGSSSPLQPLMSGLMAVQGPLQTFGAYVDSDTEKLRALQTAGMALSLIGGVVMGVAGMVTQASAPMQLATASLATSISNTTDKATGAADSIGNYTGQINEAITVGQKYGYTSDQVSQALAQLTEETRSAPEAFRELTFAETLAAASKQNLYQATATVGRLHAGLFRSLRRFGLDLPSMLVDPEKAATKAANELASATGKLGDAQRNLNDYQAKIAADEQKRQATWAAKVQSTAQAAQNAQQAYQDQLQKVSDAEQKMQDTSAAANQKVADNAQKLAQDQQNDAQKVADAQQKIQDLKSQWADQDAQRAAKAAQDQQQTTQAIIDAEQNLNDLQDQWSETPARTAKDQLTRLDQLRKAEQALEKAKADVAAKAGADQISPGEQLTRQTQMAAAQQSLNSALEKQAGLTAEAAKMQEENHKALEASTLAAQAYALAQQKAGDLQRKSQEDQQRAQAAQAQLQGANAPTLSQDQELQKLQDNVKKQQDAVAKAKAAQADAADQQSKLNARFNDAMNQFMSREQGLLDHRAHTWAGHLQAWEATLKNSVMSLGKFAPVLMTLGMGASGIGALINMTAKIREGIAKIGKSGEDTAKGVQETGKSLSGLEDAAGSADDVASKAENLASSLGDVEGSAGGAAGGAEQLAMKFGSVSSGAEAAAGGVAASGEGIMGAVTGLGAAIISPIGLIIAAIIGIAAIGYVVYRNWGTISKFLAKLWGDIESIAKTVFGDVLNFFKEWGPLILAVFVPFIGLPLLIFQHWGQIEGFFKRIGTNVLRWASAFGHDVVNGILTGLMDLMHMDMWIIEWFWQSIKKAWDWAWNELKSMGSDIVNGLINGIGSMGDAVWKAVKKYVVDNVKNSITSGFGLWSPSRVTHEHGRNIVQGLINGIMSKQHDAQTAMGSVIAGMGLGAGLGGGLQLGSGMISGSSLAPTPSGGGTVINFSVPLQVAGNVLTEKDLQNNLKTFLQQGAQQAGGIGRFLGLNVSST